MTATASEKSDVDVVVVGAGVTGLTAAWELRQAGVDVALLEASDQPGGNIGSSTVGDVTVDSGADGFLARDPAAADLCRRLGLEEDLVTPIASEAFIWVDGQLRPLPRRSLLGAPFDADALADSGIVSTRGVERLRLGLTSSAPPLSGDATVGEVMRPRVGDEVFARLIDPLIGGINAGSADRLSVEACAAPLYEALRRGGPLGPALQQSASALAPPGGRAGGTEPVFMSLRGGASRLIETLSGALGDNVRLSTPVRSVQLCDAARPANPRWCLSTARGPLYADKVLLCTSATTSARLLERIAPDAASILGGIEYASVALVTFVLDAAQVTHRLNGSGLLVPRDQGMLTTACSWASSKWSHYHRPGSAVLRVSAGRTDDRRWQDMTVAGLVEVLAGELAEMGLVGRTVAAAAAKALRDRWHAYDPLPTTSRPAAGGFSGPTTWTASFAQDTSAVRFVAWHDCLPQYEPGHLQRMDVVDECLASQAPGMVTTGAAMRGLGIPACIRQAQTAARSVI